MFHNIPLELQSLRQWINWRYEYTDDGKPTKIPLNPINGHKAAVTNPLDWNTFDRAVYASQWCNGIGFVFTKSDPYIGVDDDTAKSVSAAQHDFQNIDLRKFCTYGELSPSGQGTHYIFRGRLNSSGRRRSGIEIYDNARFFTFTGNIINNYPIADAPNELFELYDLLGRQRQPSVNDFSFPQTHADNAIVEHASSALNGAKFRDLWEGRWELHYGNLSQSEADQALVNILAFYTQNHDQLKRLFQLSALGKRKKAQRSDYLNWTIKKALDRLPPKADLDALYNKRLEILNELGLTP